MSDKVIRAKHKAIATYHEVVRRDSRHEATDPSALRAAFLDLLSETAKTHRWDILAGLPYRSVKLGGKCVRPDATVRDEWGFDRGYWAAKDSSDDLETAIRKMVRAGYPTSNILFEDSLRGILFQDGRRVFETSLDDRQGLANILNQYYRYHQRPIDDFEAAVREFKGRVPDLASGLSIRIRSAQVEGSGEFARAFDRFLDLCRKTLNPKIRREAIEEMLVQHLLTRRLFDNLFLDAGSPRGNAIAVEVERVIEALAGQGFDIQGYLLALDRFYIAIEAASNQKDDFAEKQRFMNLVCERFFQGYSETFADTHGIVYTPQEVVDFMCSSVEHILEKVFDATLSSEEVKVLDPCTGTGNFIVNIIRRIGRRELSRVYRRQLFANEVMLLPYYIASQNIEHEYSEITKTYQAFEGICFVDTLDIGERRQSVCSSMAEINTERVNRQGGSRIQVIIGNPPYNMGQINENDNNKNRKYKNVDKRIQDTYAKDSTARLKNKLYDAYVKFWRWSVDRLRENDGIVCFVTNNSFVEDITFDGMRKHLRKDFTHIYHLDLGINIRKNPQLSGTTHNVFGITPSVGITVAVRSRKHRKKKLFYHRIPYEWTKGRKLSWLAEMGSIARVKWELREPCDRNDWGPAEERDEFASYLPVRDNAAPSIFNLSSLGIGTNREEWVYGLSRDAVEKKVKLLIANYHSELARLAGEDVPPESIGDWMNKDPAFAKWTDRLVTALEAGKRLDYSAGKIRRAMFRPFVEMDVYFDALLVHRRYQQHHIFPNAAAERENRVLIVSQRGYRARTYNVFMTNILPDLHLCATADGHQCFPFYVYGEDGTNRNENISDWALEVFRKRYGKKVAKWDIFHYIYGVLNHPGYTGQFAENLKKELPRIPLREEFSEFVKAGEKLAELHVGYRSAKDYPLRSVVAPGVPLSYRIERMKLSGDKTQLILNESLTLDGIPAEAFAYRLGGKSPLEWLIDQYRVTRDHKSCIEFDPNIKESAEPIVDLVPKVIRVSVETAGIIESLPEW
jgi:predicted helicase